ncbi:hypothetical protein IVG45_18405 [Methylomonas sp. LL1]|uniref:hypothetical protein n=1 Tax=Methylomonas sp. LL1 TaxID=2785785 RepID=UPI0018C42DEF|nr:hypothetical protein [Methylomonas sp. LL1]QPK62781.1 hypothetical protein IVG45_18405 [Methylomonas sp. LL1]
MSNRSPQNPNGLLPHWLICASMLLLLLAYNIFCHVWADPFRLNLEESQRVLIRTVFYAITIALFPLTNLVRHILLRLNQTMPGEKPAEQRYLVTIIATQSMIETVSLFGLVMFILGDDFNTLYIFSLLGAVGIYLHKPNQPELEAINQALSAKNR